MASPWSGDEGKREIRERKRRSEGEGEERHPDQDDGTEPELSAHEKGLPTVPLSNSALMETTEP